MKIIAVNIGKTYSKMSVLNAAQSAWKINLARANTCTHLIAVKEGQIKGYFQIDPSKTLLANNRVVFSLTSCNSAQQTRINGIIGTNPQLKYFTVKYLN